MRKYRVLLALPLLAAAPVLAGDEVLYGPEPTWVEVRDQSKIDVDAITPIALYDAQQYIADGQLTSYIDMALKLDSPQALTRAGTSSLQWSPDKGDLTVHKVEILRGDEAIDVIGGGTRYTVLRRELQLEQRLLDGTLTATMSVPGLQVGDILRVSYSTTLKDDALDGRVQAATPVFAEPAEMQFGRAKLSWPANENVRWKVGPNIDQPKEKLKNGVKSVSLTMPVPEAKDMPNLAPGRFTFGPLFQAVTFKDWKDVSRVFADLYDTEGLIGDESDILSEIDRISALSNDPKVRAALATQSVQDHVSYLLNGMSGGNYVPQKPEETWEKRYGDCKAKTLLLLAMLHAMDIEAEPVLVRSAASDAPLEMLPMAGAFDHVLVRARIDGVSYWLDGTASGTRVFNVADTPQFRYMLPLREEGATLEQIEPRLPSQPESVIELTVDQTGGVDVPSLVTAKAVLSGATAGFLASFAKQASEKQRDEFLDRFASSVIPDASLTDGSVDYDEDKGEATIQLAALVSDAWTSSNARMKYALNDLPSTAISFSPDRSRPEWKDIPVDLGFPKVEIVKLEVLLPPGEDGFDLRGRGDLDMTYATTHVIRKSKLSGNTLEVVENKESLGGELAADEVSLAKRNAARISNSVPYLLAPSDTRRAWQYGKPELKPLLKRYEDAYAKNIARDPEEADRYLDRAVFRNDTTNLDGALADIEKAIELEPGEYYYRQRSSVHWRMGNFEKSLEDDRLVFELSPDSDNALSLAGSLGSLGKTEEAIQLVEDYDDYGEMHDSFVNSHASALGYAGRAEEGLALLNQLIEETPENVGLLNWSCWYRARFSVGEDEMIDICNSAVERSGEGAGALDSRALAYAKLGDFEKSKADALAALQLSPDLERGHFLLAFARDKLGEKEGEGIDYFKRIWPGLTREYRQYGLDL